MIHAIRPSLLLCLAAIALGLSGVPAAAQGGSATYEVVFSSIWSSATYPRQFPPSPHYSPLIGGTHDATTGFWQLGGLATSGIESMAETGSTTLLRQEVNAAIAAGGADQVIQFGGLGSSPGERVDRFTINAEFPYLTLVTMLAPSPDWFVGVSGLNLMQNGQWIDTLIVGLRLHDAGTDSGGTYLSANQNTVPPDPISYINTLTGPFQGTTGNVAQFVFTRQHSSVVYGCGTNPAGSMSVTGGSPQLGQSLNMALHDPSGTMAMPSATALLIHITPDPAFPCGTPIVGLGLSAPGSAGELLVGLPFHAIAGPSWLGSPAALNLPIPNTMSLAGNTFYVQGVLVDPTIRIGLTDGVSFFVGR